MHCICWRELLHSALHVPPPTCHHNPHTHEAFTPATAAQCPLSCCGARPARAAHKPGVGRLSSPTPAAAAAAAGPDTFSKQQQQQPAASRAGTPGERAAVLQRDRCASAFVAPAAAATRHAWPHARPHACRQLPGLQAGAPVVRGVPAHVVCGAAVVRHHRHGLPPGGQPCGSWQPGRPSAARVTASSHPHAPVRWCSTCIGE